MRLRQPDNLNDPALAEWQRVIDAVKERGRTLKSADQSLLDLYIRLWQVNRAAFEVVSRDGMTAPNGRGGVGPSPEYKALVETGKLLRGCLNDLGCTPSSRKFDQNEAKTDQKQPKKLEY